MKRVFFRYEATARLGVIVTAESSSRKPRTDETHLGHFGPKQSRPVVFSGRMSPSSSAFVIPIRRLSDYSKASECISSTPFGGHFFNVHTAGLCRPPPRRGLSSRALAGGCCRCLLHPSPSFWAKNSWRCFFLIRSSDTY